MRFSSSSFPPQAKFAKGWATPLPCNASSPLTSLRHWANDLVCIAPPQTADGTAVGSVLLPGPAAIHSPRELPAVVVVCREENSPVSRSCFPRGKSVKQSPHHKADCFHASRFHAALLSRQGAESGVCARLSSLFAACIHAPQKAWKACACPTQEVSPATQDVLRIA